MMKASPFLATVLSFTITGILLAQNPPQPSTSTSVPADDEVVRVTTNLVQIDAVVTDDEGNQVTDLRAEDFEIREDKRPQPITAFSYIDVDRKPLAASSPPLAELKNAPRIPAAPLRPEQVRRTIVFVVDDLGLSLGSFEAVRSGLKKFVDQMMRPGDLVGIVRTGGGAGALQRLTADRRQLYAAIEATRWRGFLNRVGPHFFRRDSDSGPASDSLSGTRMALQNVVRSLKAVPGRKSILFFSDSFAFMNNPSDLKIGGQKRSAADDINLPSNLRTEPDAIADSTFLAELVHASNQASVVIYTVAAFGLQYNGPTAADRSPEGANNLMTGAWMTETLDQRSNQIRNSQEGLQDLAHQTGGFAIINNNDLGNGIHRVMTDLKGYYLIGYRPTDTTFEKRDGRSLYHQISLKLKRPGLHIRARQGFYGVPDRAQTAGPHSRESQLTAALESPFVAGDIRLRLTALFGNVPQTSFVRTLIHVDVRDLTFTEQPDGWHEANIEVLASSYGENGLIADYLARSEKIRARGRMYANILRYGVNYNLLVPIKKPGAYQLRAAIRDTASDRIGSAYQFIEVPELKKGQLALSGILVSSAFLDLEALSSNGSVYNASANHEDHVQPTLAVRRFERRMLLEYRYLIYNARPGANGRLPELVAEVRLFREGQLVNSFEEPAIDFGRPQLDPKRLSARGAFRLRDELLPGQYVLQIVITDPHVKARSATASQWIDFELVK